MGKARDRKEQIVQTLENATGFDWDARKEDVVIGGIPQKQFVFTPKALMKFRDPPGANAATAESKGFIDNLSFINPSGFTEKPQGLRAEVDFTFPHPMDDFFLIQLKITKPDLKNETIFNAITGESSLRNTLSDYAEVLKPVLYSKDTIIENLQKYILMKVQVSALPMHRIFAATEAGIPAHVRAGAEGRHGGETLARDDINSEQMQKKLHKITRDIISGANQKMMELGHSKRDFLDHMLSKKDFAKAVGGLKKKGGYTSKFEALWVEIQNAYQQDEDDPLIKNKHVDCGRYPNGDGQDVFCVSVGEVKWARKMLGIEAPSLFDSIEEGLENGGNPLQAGEKKFTDRIRPEGEGAIRRPRGKSGGSRKNSR